LRTGDAAEILLAMQRLSGLVVIVFGLAGLACGVPKGKIAESSRTDACRADILGGLESLKRGLGMEFEVTDADADPVFSEGRIGKGYARDGVKFEMHFGLDATKEGDCTMRLFQKITREGVTLASTGTTSVRGRAGITALL
jgi:hypothetical protein